MTCASPSMSCRISSAHFTASALNRWRWLVGIQGLHHAARMEGSRTLALPCIRVYVNQWLEDAWRPYQMGAEQALARLANIATLDVRELFDEEGELLPVPDWPDSVRSCVEGFSADGGKFTLESPLQALRIVLEIAGKVRGLRDSVDTLADAICADKARRLSQPARLQRNMRHGPVRQHHAVENP